MFSFIYRPWYSIAESFAAWRRRQRAYEELMRLDDRSLADIGISRSDIPYVLSRHDDNGAKPSAGSGHGRQHAA